MKWIKSGRSFAVVAFGWTGRGLAGTVPDVGKSAAHAVARTELADKATNSHVGSECIDLFTHWFL